MRRFAAFSALFLAACQAQTAPVVDELTPELRAELTSELTQAYEAIMEGARNADPAMMDQVAAGDGVCVMQMQLIPCSDVAQNYRDAWSSEDPDRVVRQETDGLEYDVKILSPTLGYVATTLPENRAYTGTGEVFRASFAQFGLYERQGNGWKMIAGQQASWPMEGN